MAGAPAAADAQFPGHLEVHVTDARSGAPVAGALVTLEGQGRSASTDADGSVRFRSLESGAYEVRVSAPGYALEERGMEVEDGAVTRLSVDLEPTPFEVDGVAVAAEAPRGELGALSVGSEAIRAGGASHLGEVLDGLPGVAVRSHGPGGAAEVSIRGSGADAVLILVDGVPLNDPITGEADLSTLPAGQVENVTVLPGARSARYGPRAQGGVVLVETREPSVAVSGSAGGGSLGRMSLDGDAGRRVGRAHVGVGGSWRQEENAFRFRVPEEAGGGDAERGNADVRRRTARLGVEGGSEARRLRATVQAEDLSRGLPGKSFAPSPTARQDLERLRGSLAAQRSTSDGSQRVAVSGTLQRVHQRDPNPPTGTAYDTEPRMGHVTVRAEGDRTVQAGGLDARLDGGVEGGYRRVTGADLEETAPTGHGDVGVWTGGDLTRPDLPGSPELRLTGRLHRDGLLREVVPAHDVTVRVRPGPASLHLAHRSSFSPPTLGDQFFKEGVAVQPNPDLEAERVRGEWELGASGGGSIGGVAVDGSATLFRADVDGMIVWAPDFRFVWSPRNVDVRRRGAELSLDARDARTGLRVGSSYTLARVTYERGGGGSQVIYRPRHQGSVDLGWHGPSGVQMSLGGRYLGTRYPVPTEANALPSFWTFDLSMTAEWELGDRVLEPGLRVDRLLDRQDPFIFAFPEAGRVWEITVRVRPRSGSPEAPAGREP